MQISKSLLWTLILLAGLQITQAQPALNVKEFGATGNGITLETSILQTAIDSLDRAGGGTLYFPPGVYKTGSLFLCNNLSMHISAGATLMGSELMRHYLPHKGGVNPEAKSLLHAQGKRNIHLHGAGTINGQGESFDAVPGKDNKPTPWISFETCSNIRIEDLRMIHTPAQAIEFWLGEDIFLEEIHLKNGPDRPETSGIKLQGTTRVWIRDCFIRTGNDAVHMQSLSRTLMEHIFVSGCVLQSAETAIRMGPVSAGLVRKCRFTNNEISDTRRGLVLFMQDGGRYEDLEFADTRIETYQNDTETYPVLVEIGHGEAIPGAVDNIRFQNLNIRTSGQVRMTGHERESIESLSMEDIRLNVFKEVKASGEASEVPAIKPEGESAHLVLRHLNGLSINRLRLEEDSPSAAQYGLALYQVKDWQLSNMQHRSVRNLRQAPLMYLEGSKEGRISGSLSRAKMPALLQLEAGADGLILTDNDVPRAPISESPQTGLVLRRNSFKK